MSETDDTQEISQAMADVLASFSAATHRVAAAAIAQLPEDPRRKAISWEIDAGRCDLTVQVSVPTGQVDVMANKKSWLTPMLLSKHMELTPKLHVALAKLGDGAFQLVDLALDQLLAVHREQLESLVISGRAGLAVQRDVLGGEVRVLVDGDLWDGPQVLFYTRWLEQGAA